MYEPRGGKWEGMRCWGRDGTIRSKCVALGSNPSDFAILVFDSGLTWNDKKNDFFLVVRIDHLYVCRLSFLTVVVIPIIESTL
jgi:hypothetical protein